MSIHLRLTAPLLQAIHADLSRPHPFAAERVGFLTCDTAALPDDGLVLLARQWHAPPDDHYLDDPRVGAYIGPAAFRYILQQAWRAPVSILHLHRHDHRGRPAFSLTDSASMNEFVPAFFNARPDLPHGAVVLSYDRGVGRIWRGAAGRPVNIDRFEVIEHVGTGGRVA